jgi:hypothetical protein
MAKLPTRCKRYSVGKEIGGAVYVHRIYEGLLPEPVKIALKHLPSGFDYTVVKFVEKESCVSFILCPEFDSVDEPFVGDIVRIDAKGLKRYFRQQADPFIYHHKWLFVDDDYRGFNVEESKARSQQWISLGDVDRSRIGRQSYWQEKVIPRLTGTAPERWVRSDEARRQLKLSTCDLAHAREAGEIEFKKVGQAFLYRLP